MGVVTVEYLNNDELINNVLLLNKAIRQIAEASGAGACCGVDVGGEVSHTASTIIARYDKLTEQNKMLREALAMVVDKLPIYQNIQGGGYMIVLNHDDVCVIKETLNIGEM